jgi:hypothetical protein
MSDAPESPQFVRELLRRRDHESSGEGVDQLSRGRGRRDVPPHTANARILILKPVAIRETRRRGGGGGPDSGRVWRCPSSGPSDRVD